MRARSRRCVSRRVRRRYSSVLPGHSVVMRPSRVWYQLLQPPVVHTVRGSRCASSALKRACASAVGDNQAWLASRRIASSMKASCDSMMNTIELWPRPVFGPITVNRLGNPATMVPR